MFEKLSEFLNAQKQEQPNNLEKIWAKKVALLESVLFNFMRCDNALLLSKVFAEMHKKNPSNFNASDKDYFFSEIFPRNYKETLERFSGAVIDDIHIPIIDSLEDGQQNKLWFKLFEDDEFQIECFDLFLSEEFEVPFDQGLITLFLQLSIIYYAYLAYKMPPTLTARIDNVALELVKTATFGISTFEKKGIDHDRTLKGADAKARHKIEQKQEVLEIFIRLPATERTKNPHRTASMIKEKWGKNSPSIDTIKRYLKEEGEF